MFIIEVFCDPQVSYISDSQTPVASGTLGLYSSGSELVADTLELGCGAVLCVFKLQASLSYRGVFFLTELMSCEELHSILHLVLQAGNIMNAVSKVPKTWRCYFQFDLSV